MDTPESVPFGDLLKTLRKEKRVSQKDLSMRLGVHYNTVSKWERGMCLPDSKGMVLELARELRLNEHETRILLEASLTALSPYWSIPYPQNPFFTGREKILKVLHMHLDVSHADTPTRIYALHGLGGIGKTQIALEYAYRYMLEYSAIFWLRAETVESMMSSVLSIAETLQLPGRDGKDQERVVAAVLRWLSGHRQWLLIWDNVEDLNLLQRFLPSARQGAILLTTRQQALGVFACGIDLLPMEQEEGTLFLLRRSKVLEPEAISEQLQRLAVDRPGEYAAASEIVVTMGGLPLALDQAGAYIEESGCGLAVYLQRYERQRAHLLDRRGLLGGDHPSSVAATFRLTCEQMEREQSAAALLKVCAFLHAEAIPEELFGAGAVHLGPELAPLADDTSQFDQAIVVLRSLSLVQRQAETRTLSLHRLVQAVLREQMNDQEHILWLKRASESLNAVFPEVIYEVWKQCERLLPHVLAVATAIPDREGNQVLVAMLRKAATYLRARAQHEQAELLFQRALRIGEQVLGPTHRDVAFTLNGLALLYEEQGKYEQAEALHREALRIGEQALGPMHPDLAQLLNGLATLQWRQGKYEQAKPLYEQALHIREEALGSGHPETTALLNGLAFLYIEQGKDEQARLLWRRILHIWQRVLVADHPDLAYSLNNQAARRTEHEEEEQALSLWKQVGAQYPHVAYPLYGLAILYAREGKDERAASFYQCALYVREQSMGPEHPDLAYPLSGLANLYLKRGKYEQAEALYRKVLCLREQHLGQQHPETAQTLYDLAICYQSQNNTGEALSLAEGALKIYSQSLKDTHPKTITARAFYAQLVQEQADKEQREPARQNVSEYRKHFRKKYSKERVSVSSWKPSVV